MPLPYAPSIAPPSYLPAFRTPITAPGTSAPVPFIRRGAPPVPPIRPPLPPPLPAIVPLAAPAAAPAAGGLARAVPLGAALLGAAALGLAVGNAVYEDVLRRPFGPSLGDLLFPVGQPRPVPPEPRILNPLKGMRIAYIDAFGSSTPAGGIAILSYEIVATNPQISGPGIKITSCDGSIGTGSYTAGTVTILNYGACEAIPQTAPAPTFEPVPEPIGLPVPEPLRRTNPYRPEPLRLPVPEPVRRRRTAPRRPFAPPDVPGFTPELPFEPQERPEPRVPPFFPGPPIPYAPPIPDLDTETETDGTPRPPRQPPTPMPECCPSLEQRLDRLLDRDECEPCDLSTVENLLQQILDKIEQGNQQGIEQMLQQVIDELSAEGIGSLDLTDCDATEPVSVTYQGVGIAGLFSAVDAIAASLNVIHEDTKCEPEPCVSSVPDWWQVRKGADTPQLSIVFRKQGTRNYHSLNIPHPKVSPRPAVSAIEPYEGGQWQATIYLRDNSKFIVCAKLKGDAIRVATQAASMIEPEWLPSPLEIATTERRGFAVNQSLMEPRYMDYHPEGQKSRRALWRVPLA